MNFRNFVKRQTMIIVATVMLLTVATIGISYAVFMQIDKNSENQIVKSGSLVINFIDGDTITGENNELLPTSEENGRKMDGYDFTITNSGTLDSDYKVMIHDDMDEDAETIADYLDHDNLYICFDCDEEGNGTAMLLTDERIEKEELTTEEGISYSNYIIKRGIIKVEDSVEHDIKIWVREDANTEIIGKKVNLIIEVEAVVHEYENLADVILEQNGGSSDIEGKGSPNFANIATTEEGMFATEDDNGTSYYYRGAVKNNNVMFAGYAWKIIRINGDGSIRLIYNGANTTNTTGINTQLASTYSFNTSSGYNAYVGYMFGSANSGTYEEEQANSNDSNAKIELDAWYTSYIASKGTIITDKIVGTTFCNDRSISNGTGIGTVTTYYMANQRLYTNKEPSLKCSQKGDRFSIPKSIDGNKDLTVSVGLISADEVTYAGGVNGENNTLYYLYTNQEYWTMTANKYESSNAEVTIVNNLGEITSARVTNNIGLRPVINLKANVQISGGSGTTTDPYIII